MDEHEAIARLKRGDISGLDALIVRYQIPGIRAAYLIVRDRSLAEDIVQAAFIRAYERIEQFDAQRPFGPWFLRGVVYDAVKVVAQRERHFSLDEEFPGDETTLADRLVDSHLGPEGLVEQAEGRQAIWDALGRLTPS